jgi:hypothetical protein
MTKLWALRHPSNERTSAHSYPTEPGPCQGAPWSFALFDTPRLSLHAPIPIQQNQAPANMKLKVGYLKLKVGYLKLKVGYLKLKVVACRNTYWSQWEMCVCHDMTGWDNRLIDKHFGSVWQIDQSTFYLDIIWFLTYDLWLKFGYLKVGYLTLRVGYLTLKFGYPTQKVTLKGGYLKDSCDMWMKLPPESDMSWLVWCNRFGHSVGAARLFHGLGLTSLFMARISQSDKDNRLAQHMMEFLWQHTNGGYGDGNGNGNYDGNGNGNYDGNGNDEWSIWTSVFPIHYNFPVIFDERGNGVDDVQDNPL